MPRLPKPGGDKGTWGILLNEYLSESHNSDGSLKNIPKSKVTGLENVDNTADVDKPVSTAQAAADALARDADNLTTGTVADARLPVTAQAVTLAATYAPLAARAYGTTGGRTPFGVLDKHTGTQTNIATWTPVPVTYPNVAAGSGLDLSAANSITIPVGAGGPYSVQWTTKFGGTSGTNIKYILLTVNGTDPSTPPFGRQDAYLPSGDVHINGAVPLWLNDGDVVALSVMVTEANADLVGTYIGDSTLTLTRTAPIPIQHVACGYATDYALVNLNSVGDRSDIRRDIFMTWMTPASWSDMAAGNWLSVTGYGTLASWLAADPANIHKAANIGVPLIPNTSVSTGAEWDALLDSVTAGTHDTNLTNMGTKLAQYGPDTVYARLDWEMNLRTYTASKFQAAWARAVPIIRSAFATAARSGQILKICYSYAENNVNEMAFYPTSESLVDVIAPDVYAQIWGSGLPTVAQVKTALLASLARASLYSAQHGNKPLALGEFGQWAIGTNGVTTAHGVEDAPSLIKVWMDWAEQNQVVFVTYFDITEAGAGIHLTSTPNTATALTSRYAAL